ncbi:MAG: AraC family transcriptional regulator [Bacteroidales bacterium]|nr:AraC family transcriptional regulator [Bacteroidales bacterium]
MIFYSVCSEALALKFDAVVGNDVSHKFPVHIHDSLCIGLITKGQRNMVLSGVPRIIRQQEIFVIRRYQSHAIDQMTPHDYIAITVKGENLNNCAFDNVIASDTCIDLFLQLFDAIKDHEVHKLSGKWLRFYQYLVDTHGISSGNFPFDEGFIKKTMEYIHDHYSSQISVKDMAAHACMSTYHFCRLFKKITGLSPHNYLRQYRLSNSYRSLQQKNPVFDTAIETGFYDSSHFIRTFQAYMAVSPKEYQESVTRQ